MLFFRIPCASDLLRFPAACSALIVLSLASSLAQADDRLILRKNNEVLTGRIKKADVDDVHMDVRDARTSTFNLRKLRPDEVAEIEWDIADRDWQAAVELFKRGNYAAAAKAFASIIADADTATQFRAEAKPTLYFYHAESLYRAGKPAEAVPAFVKMINDFKNSWHLPMAVGEVVEASVQTGDFSKVPPLLAQLRTLGAEPKALADYYEGQMFCAQKKIKEADARFAAAINGTGAAFTKGLALLGQAQCALMEGNLAKSRDLAQKAMAAGSDPYIDGSAHRLAGDVLLAEVDKDKPAGEALEKKLMDALVEYMRVLELYPGEPRTEPHAMLKAGECLQRLSKIGTRGPASGDRQRAGYMLTKLANDPKYRNTPWATQATEVIKTLR